MWALTYRIAGHEAKLERRYPHKRLEAAEFALIRDFYDYSLPVTPDDWELKIESSRKLEA